jgi:hypothetical protein
MICYNYLKCIIYSRIVLAFDYFDDSCYYFYIFTLFLQIKAPLLTAAHSLESSECHPDASAASSVEISACAAAGDLTVRTLMHAQVNVLTNSAQEDCADTLSCQPKNIRGSLSSCDQTESTPSTKEKVRGSGIDNEKCVKALSTAPEGTLTVGVFRASSALKNAKKFLIGDFEAHHSRQF